MAGLFGFLGGGAKEGKGVDKDAPQKRRFFIFFDVLIRKFFKIMRANMLYVLFSLPYLLLLAYYSPLNLPMVKSLDLPEINELMSAIGNLGEMWLDITMRAMFAFFIVTFWGSGPASAGLGRVLQRYSQERHAWVWSDFWQEYKSCFKKSLIVVALDIAVIYLTTSAFMFYGSMYAANGDRMMIILQVVLCLALLMYTFMHGYIYQLMVSYEGDMKSIYRNSFLFTLARFPQNLVLTAIAVVIFMFMYLSLEILGVAMSFLILTALCTFIICFYSSGAIDDVVDSKLEAKKK